MKIKIQNIPKSIVQIGLDLGWEPVNTGSYEALCIVISQDRSTSVCVELYRNRAICLDFADIAVIDSKLNSNWTFFSIVSSVGEILVIGDQKLNKEQVMYDLMNDFIIPAFLKK